MRDAAALSRNKIQIYAPDTLRNEYGEIIKEYLQVYETGAKVEFISGNKHIENDNIVDTYDVMFTVRQYVPIEPDYLIYYRGEKYSVKYINYRSFYMDKQIKCSKVDA